MRLARLRGVWIGDTAPDGTLRFFDHGKKRAPCPLDLGEHLMRVREYEDRAKRFGVVQLLGESTKTAPALCAGEVKIYAKGDASVHVKANGDVLVKPGSAGRVELGGEGLPPTAGVVTGDVRGEDGSLRNLCKQTREALCGALPCRHGTQRTSCHRSVLSLCAAAHPLKRAENWGVHINPSKCF